MAQPTAYSIAQGSGNSIKIYDAKSGNIWRTVTLPSNEKIASAPIVFGEGFSVVVERDNSRWVKTYGFPLCNIKTVTHVS